MVIVGITGGIGSGKSTISKVFNILGVPVYDSDAESKKILFSKVVASDVINRFGDVVLKDGELDRVLLGKFVFNNPDELKWLNSLLHPKVKEAFDNWVNQQDSNYVIKEAAILFESGAYRSCDFIINVACPEEKRIARVVKRDARSIPEVKKIIEKQLSEAERRSRADYTIDNDVEKVLPQILELHHQIGSKSM